MFCSAISAITLLLRESELRIFERRNIRKKFGEHLPTMAMTIPLWFTLRKLREKIEQDPSKPEYIKTVRGLGYKFITK